MTVESETEIEVATSENAEIGETSSEDNLTIQELASNLLKTREPKEESEQTEEESETAEQAAEEEESEEQQSAEETEVAEQSEPSVETSDVLLQKYGIDLDALSKEETEALAKSLHLSAVKRFSSLTDQKNALAAENAELQLQAQSQANDKAPSEQPDFLKENALYNVNDINALTKEVENLTTLIEWTEEGLDNEVEYDDDGNEYVAKDGDKTYTKADLRRIRANARKILRTDAPARQKWIVERQQSDEEALKTFPFLSDENSEEYQYFVKTKQSEWYKPLVEYLPNGNFALSLMIEGMKAVQARRADANKPKPKPKAPVASAEAAPTKPRSESSSRKKALAQAKAKMEKSGSMADYKAYIQIARATA